MSLGVLNQKFVDRFLGGRSLPVGRHGFSSDIKAPKVMGLQPLRAPSGADGFRNAERIQESITARVEKKVLLWIAARLPLWVTSDQLTCLGLSAMLFGWGSYLLARWYRSGFLLATIALALNWFGDSLDGTLARVRDQQRPRYGFYVDHVIDSIGAVLLMTGLAVSGCVDWRIAAAMLVGFLLLSIESYLASYTIGVFRMSFWKFGPTEIRILLALGNLVLWWNPHATVFGRFRLFDFGGAIAAALMLAMFLASALRHTAHLYAEEQIPNKKTKTRIGSSLIVTLMILLLAANGFAKPKSRVQTATVVEVETHSRCVGLDCPPWPMPSDADVCIRIGPNFYTGGYSPWGVPWAMSGDRLIRFEAETVHVIVTDKRIRITGPRLHVRLIRFHHDHAFRSDLCNAA